MGSQLREIMRSQLHRCRKFAILAALTVASPAFTEGADDNLVERTNPKPFPVFTFKSVKPPKAGEAPKVDVQIPLKAEEDPEESLPDTPATDSKARYAWYWNQFSASIADADPGRIEEALVALRGPEGQTVPAPRLAALQEMAAPYTRTLMIETIGTQVSPAFALAVMWVESTGRKDAVSSAGAQGLMQLIPATAAPFGVSDSFDPVENIRGGVKYLDFLLRTFSGDPVLALAGYNAGENAVLRAQGIPEYDETRDYVPKVLAAFSIAKGLCKTPPVYVSDGCVFHKFAE